MIAALLSWLWPSKAPRPLSPPPPIPAPEPLEPAAFRALYVVSVELSGADAADLAQLCATHSDLPAAEVVRRCLRVQARAERGEA